MQRLELTWIGKDHEPRLEPRILLEKPELRCGQPDPSTSDWQGMLVHGDNLLALKALEQDYAGKVKCVYIDPPYNTGSAFEHYDDGIEHSLWLSLIRDRLRLLHALLSEDGSIWISIDDNEGHYLKVLCDEIFARKNFVTCFVWEKDKGRRNDTDISTAHDYIYLYSKNREIWRKTRNLLPRTEAQISRYKNPDNDPRGPWLQGDNGTAKSGNEKSRYPITLPSGRVVVPPLGNYWRFSRENFEEALNENRVYFGVNGDGMPIIKRYLSNVKDGIVPRTWLTAEEVGTNQSAKRDHLRKLLPEIEPFPTPKPEELLKYILSIATNPGDLVLDSFLGSGTTAAVAHKMGRHWIGIELGQHAYTHCLPRLRKVISGEDQGGISKAQGWQGGGGMRVFTLAPTLILEDRFGQPVINPEYNPQMLAAAVCKHEGYRYDPHPEQWWKQGQGAEQDYILTTTQYVNRPFLDAIQAEMQETESLLICCKAYDQAVAELWPKISLRKIPSLLATRCEFGRDDYSLNIVSLPITEEEEEDTIEELAPQVSIPPPPKQGELF